MQIIIISIFLMPFANFLSTDFPDSAWSLATHFLFYPILFFILGFFIDTDLLGFGFYHLSSYALIPTCFLIILVADYYSRISTKGNYDQIGELICNLLLGITLLLSFFPLCFLMFFSTQYENNVAGLGVIQNMQVLTSIWFVFVCLLTTVFFHFFCMFLFDIYRKKR